MTWLMRWWWLTSLVVLAGCGPTGIQSPPCAKRLQPAVPPVVVVALVGQAVTVDVEFPPVILCVGGNPVATSAETEVLDADQRPVAHEATAPSSSDVRGYSVKVTFTPRTPGLYGLSARFEPGLGIARREVLVLVDRAGEAPVARFTPEAPCDAVGEVGPYVWCERPGAALVDVYADGGLAQRLPADFVSLAGGVAWTRAGPTVTRWAVEDGGLVGQALDGLDAGAVGLTHAATAEALRFVSRDVFFEVLQDGGALEWGRVRALPVAASGRTGLLVSADGEALGFGVQDAVDGGVAPAPLPDAGEEEVADAGVARVCQVAFTGDAGLGCTPLFLELGARDGEVLWLRAFDSKRVGHLRYLPPTFSPAVVFLPAQPAALVDLGQPTPAFSWNGHTVVVRPDDLVLDAFPVPMGRVKSGASPTHVWFVTSAGEVVLQRR